MGPSNLTLIVMIIVYAAVIFGLSELCRKHMRLAAAIFILALFTCPLWGAHRDSWFEWAKIISVLVPTSMVGLMRIAQFEDRKGKFWEFFKGDWIMWFFYAILFLNITEASLRDWELGNYLNALTGFALNLTIPFAPKFWRVDKRTKGELVVDFPWGWCALYTTWNACFLLGCIPDEFAGGFAILISAEIYSIVMRRPDLYIMGRVYTLAFFVLQLGICDVLPGMDSSAWANQTLVDWWGVINVICAIAYIAWYQWQLHTGKCDKSFRNAISAPEEADQAA